MSEGFLERARAVLAHPRFVGAIGVVAFLVHAPSLGSGYVVDDHTHRFFARGDTIPGGPRGVWDTYRFADGGDGVRRAIAEGLHPWWTAPTLKLAFLRPVASVLRYVEETLFGEHPALVHLVSIALFVATCTLLWGALRRWIGGAAAGLGALLFALDDAHATTVSWIAARHALLAAFGAVLALFLVLRARDRGKSSLGAGAALLFALLSGEAALGAVPMLAVVFLVEDDRPARARAKAAAPLVAAVAVWLGLYVALGCGASSSAYYVDPVRSPSAFLRVASVRLPSLAAAQLFFPPAEVGSMQPSLVPATALLGACALVVLAVLGFRSPERRRAIALYAAFVLSLVPACGTNSDDRLLMVAGIPAFALLGVLGRGAYGALRARGLARGAALGFFAGVGLVHVVVALLLVVPRSLAFSSMMSRFVARGAETLYAFERPEDRDVLLVTSPDGLLPTSMYVSRRNAGLPVARSTRILATSPRGVVTVRRLDERTLRIEASGGMMHDPFVGAVRDAPFREGDEISAGAIVVRIARTSPAEGLVAIDVTHERSLDAPDLVPVTWTREGPGGRPGYVRFTLPRVGETASLEPVDFTETLTRK